MVETVTRYCLGGYIDKGQELRLDWLKVKEKISALKGQELLLEKVRLFERVTNKKV